MKLKKSRILFIFLLLFFFLGQGYAQEDGQRYNIEEKHLSRTQVLMGTYCTITLEEDRSDQIQKGFDLLKQLETILSSYQEEAMVYQLNRDKKVSTDKTLKKILQLSRSYYDQTVGYFDITIGSITKKLYRFGEDERIPTEIQKKEALTGIEQIKIDDEHITLGRGITIDLGGIGKGFAVDELGRYYHSQGIKKGKVALSGDIRCLDRCSIEVQDPFDPEGLIATLHANSPNLSISTSGTYRRFVKQKSEHHLIDPKKKTQGRAFASVTVVSQNNNTLCDAIATAISVMPLDTALKFVRSQDQFGYLLVTSEGEMIQGNLEKFVEIETLSF